MGEGIRWERERESFLMIQSKTAYEITALTRSCDPSSPTVFHQPLPAAHSLHPDLSLAPWSAQPQHLPGRGGDFPGQPRPWVNAPGPRGAPGEGGSVLHFADQQNKATLFDHSIFFYGSFFEEFWLIEALGCSHSRPLLLPLPFSVTTKESWWSPWSLSPLRSRRFPYQKVKLQLCPV